jgi:phage baseplate assembly protein W
MTGMSRITGLALDSDSDEHMEQSVGDILTTPLDARSMLRGYGSELFDLVDQPMNALTRIRIYAATAIALLAWEPRARLRRVQLVNGEPGSAAVRISMERIDRAGRPIVDFIIPLRTA